MVPRNFDLLIQWILNTLSKIYVLKVVDTVAEAINGGTLAAIRNS